MLFYLPYIILVQEMLIVNRFYEKLQKFLFLLERGAFVLKLAAVFICAGLEACYNCKTVYSQVHKYLDIDTIVIILALYATTMDFKLDTQYVL